MDRVGKGLLILNVISSQLQASSDFTPTKRAAGIHLDERDCRPTIFEVAKRNISDPNQETNPDFPALRQSFSPLTELSRLSVFTYLFFKLKLKITDYRPAIYDNVGGTNKGNAGENCIMKNSGCCLLGFDTVYSGSWVPTIRRNTLPPSSVFYTMLSPSSLQHESPLVWNLAFMLKNFMIYGHHLIHLLLVWLIQEGYGSWRI
jgi:hypothetical protein